MNPLTPKFQVSTRGCKVNDLIVTWIFQVYTAKVKVRLLTNNAVQENECGTKGLCETHLDHLRGKERIQETEI